MTGIGLTPLEEGVIALSAIGPFASQEELILTIVMGAMFLAGTFFVYGSIKQIKTPIAVALNRPIGAGEVADADGVVEIQGTAQPLDTLGGEWDDSDGSGGDTVEGDGEESENSGPILYVEREVEITERKGHNDSAKNRTRTIDRTRELNPFLVVDDTGEVAVDPRGADLSLREKRVTRGGRRQRYRKQIRPGDSVHVYGHKHTASDPEDAPGDDSHYVGKGSIFVISDGSQLRTVFRGVRKSIGMLVLGTFLLVISALVLLTQVLGVAI